MKFAQVYTRVSTRNQEKFGISHKMQEEECCEFAEANGYRVRVVHRETGSGFKTKQRILEMAISSLRKGEVLIVYDASRFTRNTHNYHRFISAISKKRINLIFVKSITGKSLIYPDDSRQMAIEVNQAQEESINLSRKMTDVSRFLRMSGYKKIDYGQKLIKTEKGYEIVCVPEEQKVLEEFRKKGLLLLNSGLSNEEMIDRLYIGISKSQIKYRNSEWTRENVIKVYNQAIDNALCSKCNQKGDEMIFCDVCQSAYHFKCEGLDSNKSYEKWMCSKCSDNIVLDISKLTC